MPVAAESSARLVQQVHALASEVFEERSVKFTPGRREADRLLLGVARAKGDAGFRRDVLALCCSLGLDVAACDELDLRLGEAHMVHFGEEGQGAHATRKIYLEFPVPPADVPDLRFLGWKWILRHRPVRSLYRRIPVPRPAAGHAALERLDLLPEIRAAAQAILACAATRCVPERVQLLSVSDAGTPRRSFDLNVYDAGLAVGEVADALAPALEALGHEPSPGLPLAQRLGHVSGGIGRDGAAFLTIYAGARLRRAAP